MSIFVFSLGNNVRLTPYAVKILSKSSKFPWSSQPIIFRDMDSFHFENYSDEYISGYQRYINDRDLMETEFNKAESQKIPYVVFTNDIIVFETCRVLTRKMYDKSEIKPNNGYGGWFIITECDKNTMNIKFESYDFDEFGRLDWPQEENDLTKPFDILLDELL